MKLTEFMEAIRDDDSFFNFLFMSSKDRLGIYKKKLEGMRYFGGLQEENERLKKELNGSHKNHRPHPRVTGEPK